MSIAYLNGQFLPLAEARVSPLDRGFLFADGVYEVIPVYHGIPFALEEHFTRLEFSLQAIRLQAGDRALWSSIVQELVQRNGGGHQSIYLQLTRGPASERNHAFPAQVTPTLFAMSSPMAPPLAQDLTQAVGIKAILLPDYRWLRCDIKAISLLANVLLKQQALDQGVQEAILVRDGFVTECAAANLFLVVDGEVLTAPRNHLILGGITRDITLRLARQHGVPCREAAVPEALLRQAEEIWISSSTREIVPVIEVDGQPVGTGMPGPVWRKMATHYQQFKQDFFAHPNEALRSWTPE